MSALSGVAYKVLTEDEMARFVAAGSFAGSAVDSADGYIHLSTAAQLDETVDRHFAGQAGLHVASIDLSTLGDSVHWEASRGGQLFPHVYGALPWSAVKAHSALVRGSSGQVVLPA